METDVIAQRRVLRSLTETLVDLIVFAEDHASRAQVSDGAEQGDATLPRGARDGVRAAADVRPHDVRGAHRATARQRRQEPERRAHRAARHQSGRCQPAHRPEDGPRKQAGTLSCGSLHFPLSGE